MHINENLVYLRERKELTQEEFGRIINTNKKTISGWETGADSIPINKIIDICNTYKVDINFILGFTTHYKEISCIYILDSKTISEKLKRFRINKNITQKEMAKHLEISQPSYSKYESGIVIPKTIFFITFYKKYKVDISYFFE